MRVIGGSVLMAAARRAPRLPMPWARLGVANLYRPGASTPLMLVSLGLGLSTLAAVALIQGNIRNQVLDQLPANAPTFFFIDIQNDQLAQFNQVLASQSGITDVNEVPSLRARLVSAEGRRMHVTGEMLGDEGVIAEGDGIWVTVDSSHFDRGRGAGSGA